jgi:hypothetical protein
LNCRWFSRLCASRHSAGASRGFRSMTFRLPPACRNRQRLIGLAAGPICISSPVARLACAAVTGGDHTPRRPSLMGGCAGFPYGPPAGSSGLQAAAYEQSADNNAPAGGHAGSMSPRMATRLAGRRPPLRPPNPLLPTQAPTPPAEPERIR